MPDSGPERAVVDSATNLEQQIGALSGFIATFGRWSLVIYERGSTYFLGGNFEQSGDEPVLGLDVETTDVPNLPLPDHRHRLVAG